MNVRLLCSASLLIGVATGAFGNAAEKGYGTIKGKFVLKGDVPKPVFLIKGGKLVDGGAVPKDPKICAAKALRSDALIIDPRHKGIGNVFIYLRAKPRKVHPKLRKAPATKLEFDQVGCRFIPHTLFVRTGQTVLVKSNDNCSHNTHTVPFANEEENFTVTPKFRKGIPLKFESSEPLPMKVKCDIHPWMNSFWLVLNHPYGAITVSVPDTKKKQDGSVIGTFEIPLIPYGEYTFVVWHEEAGYITVNTMNGLKVKVDKPIVDLKTISVPAKEFQPE